MVVELGQHSQDLYGVSCWFNCNTNVCMHVSMHMCVHTHSYVCTYVKIPTDVEIVDFITIHTKLSGCHPYTWIYHKYRQLHWWILEACMTCSDCYVTAYCSQAAYFLEGPLIASTLVKPPLSCVDDRHIISLERGLIYCYNATTVIRTM